MGAQIQINAVTGRYQVVPFGVVVSLTNAAPTGTSQLWEVYRFPTDVDGLEPDFATNFAGWTVVGDGSLSKNQPSSPFAAVTFKPDITGDYLIRLTSTESPTAVQTAVVRVKDIYSEFTIPIAGETTESSAKRGWSEEHNKDLKRLAKRHQGYIRVVNQTGGSLARGKVVKISGTVDTHTVSPNVNPGGTSVKEERLPTVALADNTAAGADDLCYAILDETIANNGFGWAQVYGVFEGKADVNFTGFTVGTRVYFNSTGTLISSPPGSGKIIPLATVLETGSSGSIFVLAAGRGSLIAHASTHQHGGTDEVATATPTANAIPKASAGGKLDSWISDAASGVKGLVELDTDLGGTASAVQVVGLRGAALPANAANSFIKRNATNTGWELITYSGLNLDTDLAAKAATATTVTAGAGLTGGGDLSANRTFDVGAGTGITVNANDIAVNQSVLAVDAFAAPTDITTHNASTTAHGFSPKATAPAAGLLSVLGIGNGETVRTDKALFDTTNPAALGTAGPGTALVAARRDHIHANPAIDTLAAATDITALNASTTAHGLLKKLDNDPTHFMDGQGNWSPTGGGVPVFNFNVTGTTPLERWYIAGHFTGNIDNSSGASISSDFAYALPILSTRGGTVDRLYFNVIAAAGAASNARIAIFSATSQANPYPDALVGQATVSTNSTGNQTATVSLTLTAGKLYWIAFKCNHAGTVTLAAVGTSGVFPFFGLSNAFSINPGVALKVASTGNTDFGSTFPASATVLANNSSEVPALGFRFSA